MRVKQRHAFSSGEVLADQRFQQRRFSRAGLANHVQVRLSIRLLDAKELVLVAEGGPGKDGQLIRGMRGHTSILARGAKLPKAGHVSRTGKLLPCRSEAWAEAG